MQNARAANDTLELDSLPSESPSQTLTDPIANEPNEELLASNLPPVDHGKDGA